MLMCFAIGICRSWGLYCVVVLLKTLISHLKEAYMVMGCDQGVKTLIFNFFHSEVIIIYLQLVMIFHAGFLMWSSLFMGFHIVILFLLDIPVFGFEDARKRKERERELNEVESTSIS